MSDINMSEGEGTPFPLDPRLRAIDDKSKGKGAQLPQSARERRKNALKAFVETDLEISFKPSQKSSQKTSQKTRNPRSAAATSKNRGTLNTPQKTHKPVTAAAISKNRANPLYAPPLQFVKLTGGSLIVSAVPSGVPPPPKPDAPGVVYHWFRWIGEEGKWVLFPKGFHYGIERILTVAEAETAIRLVGLAPKESDDKAATEVAACHCQVGQVCGVLRHFFGKNSDLDQTVHSEGLIAPAGSFDDDMQEPESDGGIYAQDSVGFATGGTYDDGADMELHSPSASGYSGSSGGGGEIGGTDNVGMQQPGIDGGMYTQASSIATYQPNGPPQNSPFGPAIQKPQARRPRPVHIPTQIPTGLPCIECMRLLKLNPRLYCDHDGSGHIITLMRNRTKCQPCRFPRHRNCVTIPPRKRAEAAEVYRLATLVPMTTPNGWHVGVLTEHHNGNFSNRNPPPQEYLTFLTAHATFISDLQDSRKRLADLRNGLP